MEFFESLSFISRGSFNISEAFNDRINKKAQVAIIYLIYSIYRYSWSISKVSYRLLVVVLDKVNFYLIFSYLLI